VDLAAVDARLRRILEPHRRDFEVTQDGPGGVSLYLKGLADKPYGYVAGVRPGKRYVSYYLMPFYAFPEMLEDASPQLRRRMQGKSCFNFSHVDAAGTGPFADEAQFGRARAGG
jgi:hypothetical protein